MSEELKELNEELNKDIIDIIDIIDTIEEEEEELEEECSLCYCDAKPTPHKPYQECYWDSYVIGNHLEVCEDCRYYISFSQKHPYGSTYASENVVECTCMRLKDCRYFS